MGRHLTVRITSARNLLNPWNGGPADASVKVIVRGDSQATRTVNNSTDPLWFSKLEFQIPDDDDDDVVVKVEVCHRSSVIGRTEFGGLVSGEEVKGWYDLEDCGDCGATLQLSLLLIEKSSTGGEDEEEQEEGSGAGTEASSSSSKPSVEKVKPPPLPGHPVSSSCLRTRCPYMAHTAGDRHGYCCSNCRKGLPHGSVCERIFNDEDEDEDDSDDDVYGSDRAKGTDTAVVGTRLLPGDTLVSSNGRHRFVHQHDGNVVLYSDGTPTWATDTDQEQTTGQRHKTTAFTLDPDGRLILYAMSGNGYGEISLWSGGTQGKYFDRLVMEDYGNCVAYQGSYPVWSTNTDTRRDYEAEEREQQYFWNR